MSKTANAQELQNHIDTDIRACDALLRLLDEEREALKIRDADALEKLIEEKLINLQQLEASAKQRRDWVNEAVLKQNPVTAHQQSAPNQHQTPEQTWLELLNATSPSLIDLWKSLKQKLKTCQEQNEVNGKVLARNQQVFKRILSMMRGQTEPQDLYNQGGGRSTNQWQQTLGEA